ncbi:nitroreductase family deazaflavin-dependent oxidoreductase [Myxococcota bacterium]|nr:nitroreductase family deazaflavin-dependent oxidoreductase [Myxococcota bacterium]
MKATEWVVRFAVSPPGFVLDQWVVRHLGHSPVSWLFARADRTPYNAPLLLTAIGAKTGRERSVVLPYFPAGDDICVVGSKGGAPTDPYWARNLRANPRAKVRIHRRTHEVVARLAQGDERASLWGPITARAPVYLEYQQRAEGHREIPVFVIQGVDIASLV